MSSKSEKWEFLLFFPIFTKGVLAKTQWIRNWKWEFSVKSENLSLPPPHYNLTIVHWLIGVKCRAKRVGPYLALVNVCCLNVRRSYVFIGWIPSQFSQFRWRCPLLKPGRTLFGLARWVLPECKTVVCLHWLDPLTSQFTLTEHLEGQPNLPGSDDA